MEVDIGLRLPNADHAYYRNRPGVKQPGNCVICGGWLSNENNAHKDASVKRMTVTGVVSAFPFHSEQHSKL